MSLSFNANDARKADAPGFIRETGKYVGVITQAQKLVSDKGTAGVGLSFKSDDGATANYLDVYTARGDGSLLWGNNIINSLLCCLGLKDVAEGEITFDKWDKAVNEVVKDKAPGYPSLMGKRIGLILQKELQTNQNTGADSERMNIVGVYQDKTGLTASEILDGKTKPERADAKFKALLPVRDNRKKGATTVVPLAGQAGYVDPAFDDDLKF